jgi:pimeloyl-ACP methyl ester carboxylesterase
VEEDDRDGRSAGASSGRQTAGLQADQALRAGGAVRMEAWQLELHGHRVIYRSAGAPENVKPGRGPVVLIHGMVNSSRHWRAVAEDLGRDHYVIAPDLIGHGDSATPRGDYSLGAHAAYIRDLLAVLGVERATIVGHSLGGGVAMQFYYQFPQRVERLALISSGGLGHEVSPLLRSAALPGIDPLLALVTNERVLSALWRAGDRLQERGVQKGVYLQAIARALQPLRGRDARAAFLHTLRAVIDVRGQRVAATDRLRLLAGMPTLIIWGARDRTIPVEHGRRTHEAVGHSRLVLLERAAHFPHLEDPAGVSRALRAFIAQSNPGYAADGSWAELIAPNPARRQVG